MRSLIMTFKICALWWILLNLGVSGLDILPVWNSTSIGKLIFNVCEEEAPLLIVYKLSFSSCVAMCQSASSCRNGVYNRVLSTCALISRDITIVNNTCTGVVMFVIAPSGSSNLHEYTFCPAEMDEVDANAIVLGNGQNIGSKRTLQCVNGYEVDGQTSVTCLANSQWSDRGHCVQVCSAPEHVQHLMLSQISQPTAESVSVINSPDESVKHILTFVQGTNISVTCSAGKLVGPHTVSCASGNWTELPVCQLPTMRMPCQEDVECVDEGSHCRDGRCWCTPGKSYLASGMACVDECGQYGSTFQKVASYIIDGFDAYSQAVHNKSACRELCRHFTEIECKSADYRHSTQLCYINEELPYQVPDHFKVDPNFDFFQRDCI